MRRSLKLLSKVLFFGRGDAAQQQKAALPFGELAVNSIACGSKNSAAIVDGKALWMFGSGSRGELCLGQAMVNAQHPVRVSVDDVDTSLRRAILGPSTTALISSDGKLYMAGEGREGALGVGGQIGPVGSYHGGQQPDAVYEPRLLSFFNDNKIAVKDAALSRHFSLFLTEDGSVYSCGSGFHGELGLGRSAYATSPQLVLGLPDPAKDPVVSIAAGTGFSLAATKSGKLFFWGRVGSGGQPSVLGQDGKISTEEVKRTLWHPTVTSLDIPGYTNIDDLPLRLVAGAQHALITDGVRVWMLGYYSGASSKASSRMGNSEAHLIDCGLREVNVEASLGHVPTAITDIACGPFASSIIADGSLLLAGRLTGLESLLQIGGQKRQSQLGPIDAPDFASEPILAASRGSLGGGELVAVAIGGSHAMVMVD